MICRFIQEINQYLLNKKQQIANTLIATGHIDGMITIWEYNKKKIVKEIFAHKKEVR